MTEDRERLHPSIGSARLVVDFPERILGKRDAHHRVGQDCPSRLRLLSGGTRHRKEIGVVPELGDRERHIASCREP